MSTMEDIFRNLGRVDALDLRDEASGLTGTQIIDREVAIPVFDSTADYTSYPVGSPVADGGQVWLLITPHNAANYQGRPATLRALWGLAHTTNPERAKAWVDPYGTSGIYKKGEVYKDESGAVWRAKNDNTSTNAATWPDGWEQVSVDD